MKKIAHDCANVAGFGADKIQKIVDEEKANLKQELKKLGIDALKLEINWDLLSESEQADLAYRQVGRDI